MNIFRSLIGRVWHDPNAAEVVKISEGQLNLVRSGTIRTDRECIYNDAMATIRRVPNVEHHFQLVITRVYEEGDQELLEDEDETDEERVFLIAAELQFRTSQTEEEPTFVWRDLEGDVDEFYEFVARGANEPTIAFFETCMYRAMYERKYQKSADNTQDSDLQEFLWKPTVSKGKGKGKAAPRKKGSTSSVSKPESSPPATMKRPPSSPPKASAASTPPEPPAQPESSQSTTASGGSSQEDLPPAIVSLEAELYLFNHETGVFVLQANVVARIVQPEDVGPYTYFLVTTTPDTRILAHRVATEMNSRFSTRVNSFTWNHESDSGLQTSWCLRFGDLADMETFKLAYSKALYETSNGSPWEKIKAEEQAYVARANEDVEMRDVEDDEDEEDTVADELDKSEDEEEEGYESAPEGEEDQPGLPKGAKNSQLTVGYKGDRSYVVRGNNIGVFSHTSGDNEVKYYSTIGNLATPKGKLFNPKHVMLHHQDSKMILMNPAEPNSLFNLDIERGKIVEEWKVHDDIRVDHIAPDNKFAQTTTEATVVGASHNALFRIDPRVSGNKMVDSQYKQYVSKNKFSGITTTASGKLAVASEKGDIRLFDSIGKNAKTALPPLGDPIIGIDVTANGRYVVATTKTYLLLIDTLIGEGRYAGSLGFDRSFPANSKPIPRRLQLRAEHVAYMQHSVSFSPARFNMGEGQEENAIVTSTGQFVVAWDFAKVKKGHLDKYEIKKYEDFVVQDNFKFGDDKEIIVALENNVLAVNKKNLKRPTRASLATPIRNLHSRSSIVNSPF